MASALATKLMAEARLRKRFNILPGIDPSRKIELMYRNELLRLVNKLVDATSIESIDPALFPVKDVVPDDQLQATLQRIEQLKHEFELLSTPVSRKVVNSASDIHKNIFMRQMRQHLGIDVKKLIERENLSSVLQRSIDTNVNLVKDLQKKYLDQIKSAVENAQINGSKGSLTAELEKIQGITKNRAKLIARDQAAKFNLQLTEARQTNLGIEEYIWTTSQDERVRDSHAEKNGKTFRWDSPPADTGHPGEDIQCRCIARPVIRKDSGQTVSKTAKSVEKLETVPLEIKVQKPAPVSAPIQSSISMSQKEQRAILSSVSNQNKPFEYIEAQYKKGAESRIDAIRDPKLLPEELKNLSVEERKAVGMYTHAMYHDVNILRKDLAQYGKTNYWRGKKLEAIQKYDSLLNSSLEKAGKFEGTVYRNIDIQDWQLSSFTKDYKNSLKTGKPIQFDTYLSTSRVTDAGFEGNVTYVIQAKKKSGVLIENISAAPKEKEVLFKPGMKFQVTDFKKVGNKVTIYGTEV